MFPAFSQDLRFSFLANPQINWLSVNEGSVKSDGASIGLNTGIEMDWFFAERYAISTGITINNLGGKLIYSDSINFNLNNERIKVPSGNTINYKLQYIAVPIGLKFKTIEIGYATYWVNAGITPMVNIRSRATDSDELLNKTSISEETDLFNMNYFIEGGLEYSLGGSTAIIAGIGYNSGFMDVTNRAADKINANSFSLVLGILF
jgi:outer membrane protein with beta-barrel domain